MTSDRSTRTRPRPRAAARTGETGGGTVDHRRHSQPPDVQHARRAPALPRRTVSSRGPSTGGSFDLVADGTVIIIGGAEDKVRDRVILSRFVALAGGRTRRSRSSARPPRSGLEAGERYRAVFSELGIKTVRPSMRSPRPQANDEDGGPGRRRRHRDLPDGRQPAAALVHDRPGPAADAAARSVPTRGAVVAGTSAGASAMSSHMIAFGASGRHRSIGWRRSRLAWACCPA